MYTFANKQKREPDPGHLQHRKQSERQSMGFVENRPNSVYRPKEDNPGLSGRLNPGVIQRTITVGNEVKNDMEEVVTEFMSRTTDPYFGEHSQFEIDIHKVREQLHKWNNNNKTFNDWHQLIDEMDNTLGDLNPHKTWLDTETDSYDKDKSIKPKLIPLILHEAMSEGPSFEHYNKFDKNMIWRFSSRPSTEMIYIKEGTPYREILDVISRHSGGNDKTNRDVNTLSFGRNIGALMGTAASEGGDKHVINIIDKAEYLIGIDIGSLEARGISAHPAMARAISLFETEYVLVSTPGDDPVSLLDLATVRYKNPFSGEAIKLADVEDKATMGRVIKEMGTIDAEDIDMAFKMDPEEKIKIIEYMKKVKKAADEFAPAIRERELSYSGDEEELVKRMMKYNEKINRL